MYYVYEPLGGRYLSSVYCDHTKMGLMDCCLCLSLFLSLISFKISGVFHLALGYELSYTDTLMARISVILLSMNSH